MMQSGGRSSAMKPVLCAMVLTLIGLRIAPQGIVIVGMELKALMGISFVLVLLVAMGIYVFYSFTNPRLLQSEHYQLAMRKMDLAIQRTGTEPVFIEGSNTNGLSLHDRAPDSNKDEEPQLTGAEVGVEAGGAE